MVDEPQQGNRRAAAMRLLAAALAGGIGAFGIAATTHVAPPSAPAPVSAATDSTQR